MKRRYFDYAATTPLDTNVARAIRRVQRKVGNASSVHSFGRAAAQQLDAAREVVARFLEADFHDILFTSGATEANNIAIAGLIERFANKRPALVPHVITSTIEHSSVRETIAHLEREGRIEVTWVDVDADGLVAVQDIKAALRDTTVLVSVMYANNEIGTIQPIRKIGKMVAKANAAREREIMQRKTMGERDLSFGAFEKIYFHTDAVQAAAFLDMSVLRLHVDMLSFSAHKIYGPQGVGVLYVKAGTPLTALMHGRGQELSVRPGTYNLAGIVGCARACEVVMRRRDADVRRLTRLRDTLRELLTREFPDAVLNGSVEERLCNNLNISFLGHEQEVLVHQLDARGIAVSAGSACASGAVEVSHVMRALTDDAARSMSALRITMGRQTTMRDVRACVTALRQIVDKKR